MRSKRENPNRLLYQSIGHRRSQDTEMRRSELKLVEAVPLCPEPQLRPKASVNASMDVVGHARDWQCRREASRRTGAKPICDGYSSAIRFGIRFSGGRGRAGRESWRFEVHRGYRGNP